jgi:hypothetical protein
MTIDGVETELRLAFTRCRFGGERAWLRCPGCLHRRVALFVHRKAVACRECFGLRYRSQLQDAATRLEERAERIERAIGWDGESDTLTRPKGMHRETYRRRWYEAQALYARAGAIEDERDWRLTLRFLAHVAKRR